MSASGCYIYYTNRDYEYSWTDDSLTTSKYERVQLPILHQFVITSTQE